MNAPAYLQEDVLLDTHGLTTVGVGNIPASPGTFLLRRTHYFKETGQSDETGYELPLSTEQQQALTNLVRDGDTDAKQRMIVNNLMVNIARHYTNRGVALSDLIRKGNQGLICAMEKFDAKSGFCFSIYALQCIGLHIERFISHQNNPTDCFQENPAHALSFDNPAHKRSRT